MSPFPVQDDTEAAAICKILEAHYYLRLHKKQCVRPWKLLLLTPVGPVTLSLLVLLSVLSSVCVVPRHVPSLTRDLFLII